MRVEPKVWWCECGSAQTQDVETHGGVLLHLTCGLPIHSNKVTAMAEYIGFQDRADMLAQFEATEEYLADLEVIYAEYDYGNWEGSAWVLLRRLSDGEFYEVHASHCSCYGLEGQWYPEHLPAEVVIRRAATPSSRGSAELNRLLLGHQ